MTDRVFIIGDVHGMSDALRALVAALKPEAGDRFMFLGDLVDKGPESLAVVRYVRELTERHPGSLSLCGNHEESALGLFLKAAKAGTWTGIAKAEKETWLREATTDDIMFLRSLPLYARPFADRSALLVHGGLFPAYFDKYPGLPELSEGWHKGGGKQMDRARRFLRVRHVHRETGDMVTFGQESDQSRHWTDWYDGREGFVFYGHDPQKSGQVRCTPHSMGMDTGAVFGGQLTAAVLTEEHKTSRIELVSVKAEPYAQWLDTSEE